MEDSKNLDHLEESTDKDIKKEALEIKNKESEAIENSNNELNQNIY